MQLFPWKCFCAYLQDLYETAAATVAAGLGDSSANTPDPSSAEASSSSDTLTTGQIIQALVRHNLAQVTMKYGSQLLSIIRRFPYECNLLTFILSKYAGWQSKVSLHMPYMPWV